MKRFTDAIRKSVADKNWYAALTVALMLPDVCGQLETPKAGSKARYMRWFDEWLLHLYTAEVGAQRILHTFMRAEDCYALRCSFLHAGVSDISDERIRRAITDFTFISPPSAGMIHRNQIGSVLQLQVDLFALEIADAVDKWAASKINDAEVQERMKTLLIIHDPANGVPGFITVRKVIGER